MDNFEYSIQINDRDWAEFYAAAEECNLMQVALATEEELILSDPELEDSKPLPSATSSAKLIRVSLCPTQEEHPTVQSKSVLILPAKPSKVNFIGQSEDVLSGSEDEEELGSVLKFLCQRNTPSHKEKVALPCADILLPKTTDNKDISSIDSVNECLAGHLKSLHNQRKLFNEMETSQDIAGNIVNINNMSDKEKEAPHVTNGNAPSERQYSKPKTGSFCLPNGNNSSDDAIFKTQPPHSINSFLYKGCNPGENISSSSLPEDCMTSVPWEYNNIDENVNSVKINQSEPEVDISARWSQEEYGCLNVTGQTNKLLTSKDKNIQGLVESLESRCNNTSKSVVCDVGDGTFMQKSGSDSYINWDSNLGNHTAPLTERLNIHAPEEANVIHIATHETGSEGCKLSAGDDTNLRVRLSSNQTVDIMDSSVPLSTEHFQNTILTIPEMYEFFYRDTSEGMITEKIPRTSKKQGEGIMYTPEMYEYFFIENGEEEIRTNLPALRQKRKGSCIGLVLSPVRKKEGKDTSEVLCVPEAYEFFFAERDDDQQGGKQILFGIPAFQAKNAAEALQTFLPQGLCRVRKGIAVRETHHMKNKNERFSVPERIRTMGPRKETTVAIPRTRESAISNISSGKGEMCLLFLAFASWAVKSSDLGSPDGWKTALIANLGAISAIRYLRKRSGKTWQEP
ncbi:PGC-1 and ERR-induced regulator in muscle protein 1 [Bombina bombina]|uniref:PGC-1 and ERR-induced regulator in muscle protein 1 n=1 Tax=Bombina bombina TaxID=8345 RepID=UPI00235ADCDD|nr:PGC-1 and ERR-induced regulator in muscle protein 1 [Bombina bombina]